MTDLQVPDTKIEICAVDNPGLVAGYGVIGVDYFTPSNLFTAGKEMPFRIELVSF